MSGFSKFFIDRPIFAGVISFLITLAGGVAVWTLPIAQYPEISPPTVQATCFYPGANARVLADTVAAPLEQQIVGVENMLYMSSQCGNDGQYSLSISFAVGSDLNLAQILVQNRVSQALPLLPDVVRQTGVTVKKRSPDILLVANLFSPNETKDRLYLSNYATIHLRDELAKVPGVGDATIFGQQDYSMRVWLDPTKLAAREMTVNDVLAALREQNVQVAAGSLGRPPVPQGQAFQYTLSAQGRLSEVEQFADIILKTGENGQVVRLRNVVSDRRTDADGRSLGGIELGARSQDIGSSLDGTPAVGVAIFQQPGSNALAAADAVKARIAELKERFPEDVDYAIRYDTTPFIRESIREVFKTLGDAVVLVAIVVLVFLQSWRASIIPLIAIPVSIVGTFAVMALAGFSLNNLSMFGLVLAIGIVVDDAIVVVEAIEHHLEEGLAPRDAARKAMDEVAAPIVAISLVLMAVFVPCAFITGLTGQFFKQFALTIAASTAFSAINSLTLSPALAALILKPKAQQRDILTRLINFFFGWFFKLFNAGFRMAGGAYAKVVGWSLRLSALVLLLYGGLLFLTYLSVTRVPTGFVPQQDKGYLIVSAQLPDAASLERTQNVMSQIERIALGDPESGQPGIAGVGHTVSIPGLSLIAGANTSNAGTMFVVLDEFEHRREPELGAGAIAKTLGAACFRQIEEAQILVLEAPPVSGVGNASGFKMMIQDRGEMGLDALQAAAQGMVEEGAKLPGLVGFFTPFRANEPQLFVDVDRTKCKTLGVPLSDVFLALQVSLGGYYVNDINRFGRTWQVNVQADPKFRLQPSDVKLLKVRNQNGQMVPLSSLADIREISGPSIITRYNGVTAAAVQGVALPGVGTGRAIEMMEALAVRELPQSMTTEWTELTYLQITAGNTALIVFALATVLVFLVLAAQYESLRLPLAVILVVPTCLLCSIAGIALAGSDINIFVQIGFIVLVGLASKNAILIVEFAKSRREQGASAHDAAIEACRLRLRPILMTSFAFIFGVIPLVLAVGAGAEMRRVLGIAVFSGMLGVTFFGLFLTPVFYYVVEWFGSRRSDPDPNPDSGPNPDVKAKDPSPASEIADESEGGMKNGRKNEEPSPEPPTLHVPS